MILEIVFVLPSIHINYFYVDISRDILVVDTSILMASNMNRRK